MSSKFKPDWYAAQAQDEADRAAGRSGAWPPPRTLPWYIARAAEGDVAAAERALELIAGSTSAGSIRENGGQLDPDVRAFLLHAAQAALKPKAQRGRKPDPAVALRDWWLCVEMRRVIVAGEVAGEPVSLDKAAHRAIQTVLPEGAPEPDEKHLAKRYRELQPTIDVFLREQSSNGE